MLFLLGFFLTQITFSQVISKDELLFLTSEWKGERFPDGRPKISDDLINRAKKSGLKKPGLSLTMKGIQTSMKETGKHRTATYRLLAGQ